MEALSLNITQRQRAEIVTSIADLVVPHLTEFEVVKRPLSKYTNYAKYSG